MGQLKDRTGQRFGRLQVLQRAHRHPGTWWLCQCDCGVLVQVNGTGLYGNTRSCGCLKRDATIARNKAKRRNYAASRDDSDLYVVWYGMIVRCTHPQDPGYVRYGARGIRVCDEWLASFQVFKRDVGPRPTLQHTLDRYPDNTGHYEPGNVRWATRQEQARNTRTNINLTFRGETRCVADWAARQGIERHALLYRVHSGWSVEDALLTPVNHGNKKGPRCA